MRLELRSTTGVQITRRLRSFVEKKLRFASGRLGHRIKFVRVRLTDINGPKGGDDVQCCIQAGFGAGVVTINETRRNPFAAVARASERARQSLARHMERARDARKGRRGRARDENQDVALRGSASTTELADS